MCGSNHACHLTIHIHIGFLKPILPSAQQMLQNKQMFVVFSRCFADNIYPIAGWIEYLGYGYNPFRLISGAGCSIFGLILHAKIIWSGLDVLPFLHLFPDIPMGHEATVYLPLVSNTSSEECSTQNKCNTKTRYYGLALREVVLLFVILVQAVALVIYMFSSSHGTQMTCICPHSDRPLLYCRCSIVAEIW